jgi:hypothetical protein
MVRREPNGPDRASQRQRGSGLYHLQGPGRRDELGGLHLPKDSRERWQRDPRYHPERSDRSGVCWGCADINAYLKTKADRYASAYVYLEADRYASAYVYLEAARHGSAHKGPYCGSTNGYTDNQAHLGPDTDDRIGSDEDASAYAYLEAAHYRTANRGPYRSATNGHTDNHTGIQAYLDSDNHRGSDDLLRSDGGTLAYANEHQCSDADGPARSH